MAADTGNGATIAFSITGITLRAYDMEIGEQTIAVLDKTVLTDTGFIRKMPGDLVDPGDVEVNYEYNPNSIPPLGYATPSTQTYDVVTITYPVQPGQTNGATLVGTAFISTRGGPRLANNEIMKGKIKITWNGDTGPTYTGGS